MKVLFCHIPKTAGTSIEQVLSEKYNYPDWMMLIHKLSTIVRRCKYYNYVPDYSFTVVRNPYDRIASIFKHTRMLYKMDYDRLVKNHKINLQDISRGRYVDYIKYTTLGFDDWLKYVFYERVEDRLLTMRIVPLGIIQSQSEFIDCDYDIDIIKFEELHKLEEKLNVQLPKLNVSSEQPIVWTETGKKIIQDAWGEDFVRFGYQV